MLTKKNGWGEAFNQKDLLDGSGSFLNTLREILYNEK